MPNNLAHIIYMGELIDVIRTVCGVVMIILSFVIIAPLVGIAVGEKMNLRLHRISIIILIIFLILVLGCLGGVIFLPTEKAYFLMMGHPELYLQLGHPELYLQLINC